MPDNENIIDVSLNNGENVITVQPLYGPAGNGISSIVKTASSGLVDTYTITFTNGLNTSFNVTNGRSIVSCELTESSNLTDTYTITYNDGTTTEFTVTNDAASVSIVANDISNIDAVAEKLTEIDSVADDLANINSVAADLANIDEASSYADNSSVWAEGTDEQVQALGGTHSAKVWSTYSSAVTNQDVRVIKANQEGSTITASTSTSTQSAYNDIVSYAYSTFDLSKFTVTGTPSITADGIVTNYSQSNYLEKTGISLSGNEYVVKVGFNIKSEMASGAQNVIFGTSPSTARIFIDTININGNYKCRCYLTDGTNAGWSATEHLELNTDYIATATINIVNHTNSIVLYKADGTYVGGQTYTIPTPLSNWSAITSFDIGNASHNETAINLKYFSVTVDGVMVISGNVTGTDTYTINGSTVTIPFTWSKTGSKIVDASQSTNIANLYAQEGIAPYYMLDEANGTFALPQGEIYGMIGTAYRRGLPDYSSPVSKTNSFTAEADGFVYCAFEEVTDGLSYLVTINDSPVGKYELDDSSALSEGSIFLPVSKGDVFLLSADSNPNSVTPVYTVKFYPIKGV